MDIKHKNSDGKGNQGGPRETGTAHTGTAHTYTHTPPVGTVQQSGAVTVWVRRKSKVASLLPLLLLPLLLLPLLLLPLLLMLLLPHSEIMKKILAERPQPAPGSAFYH